MQKLTDREKTNILTKIGYLWLKNKGCYAICTEMTVRTWFNRPWRDNYKTDEEHKAALKAWEEETGGQHNNHYIIDLLGIQTEYQKPTYDTTQNGITNYQVNKQDILRGIEIKVSRKDFKNGFIHSGCNYNYLLIPKGLVEPEEVNKNVGILEVDLQQPTIKTTKWFSHTTYELPCLTIIRKPKRHEKIDENAVNNAKVTMIENLTNQTKLWLIQELSKNETNNP